MNEMIDRVREGVEKAGQDKEKVMGLLRLIANSAKQAEEHLKTSEMSQQFIEDLDRYLFQNTENLRSMIKDK